MAVSSVNQAKITRFNREKFESCRDLLAVEEPLEIRLQYGPEVDRKEQTLSITMRTPGNDEELTAGFLWTEGLITAASDIRTIHHCLQEENSGNVIKASISPSVEIDFDKLSRHFYTSSSCGVCGKTSMEAVTQASPHQIPQGFPQITREQLYQLPKILREKQLVFEHTGGLHASGLFGSDGRLVRLREDVGRHNALDKLIGSALLKDGLPLFGHAVLVSGRASFELVQKAYMAGIPIMAAVGAPSSLAVDLARDSGMTLIGFLRENKFNVYTGAERVLS